MGSSTEQHDRITRVLGVLAAVLILLGIAGTSYLTMVAIRHRHTAQAASNLHFAAATIGASGSDQYRAKLWPGQTVEEALAVLEDVKTTALDMLSSTEQRIAQRLLDALVECVDDDESTNCSSFNAAHHAELHWLLTRASDNAADRANRSEARALVGGTASMTTLLVGAGSVLAARRNRSEARTNAAASRRFQALLRDSPDIIVVIKPNGVVSYRSPSADRLLEAESVGISDLLARAEVEDRTQLRVHLRWPGAEHRVLTLPLTTRDGQRRWFELRVSDMTSDKDLGGHVVTAHEVTAEVALREDLHRQAYSDALTGLPNRRALESVLSDAKAEMLENGGQLALMVLDLDGFKQINDTLGHQAGDAVLSLVANRLKRSVGTEGTVVRVGGDEFAVAYPTVADEADAKAKAIALLNVLDSPFSVFDRTEQLRASVGVAVANSPTDAATLMEDADIAMYQGKHSGGHRVKVFRSQMRHEALSVSRLAQALRTANYDDEFHLVYQPIVATDDDHVVAFEALLRWRSPTLGDVSPGDFIPVAEMSGEISSIGRWVFNQVCLQLRAWDLAGLTSDVMISVNVSARELSEPDFVDYFLSTIGDWDVEAGRLIVEVTETSVLEDDATAAERLGALRSAGFKIAIDDFGSGYSNLGQLLSVPFDILKLDSTLILNLSHMAPRSGAGSDAGSIVDAVASIAKVLGATALCEGVEEEGQRDALRRSGIPLIQGYLCGRPKPPELIELPSETGGKPDRRARISF